MANFSDCNDDFNISVPSYDTCNTVTYYKIDITIKDVTWHVARRYKDFVQLHDTLVFDHGISKNLLPPKKILGNREHEFIEKRRISLEVYIKTIVNFLQKAMPPALRKFLEFEKYDILFIVQELAYFCFSEGDKYLQQFKNYLFNPLQLHSVSKRLEQACPITESYDRRYDLSHVLDFCSNLNSVTIRGGNSNIGTSNLIYNKLPFELSAFKNANNLFFYNARLENIYNLGCVRQNVSSVVACNSAIKTITDVLMCDKVHRSFDDDVLDESLLWVNLIKLDLSWNEINEIDKSVKLASNLRKLIMDGNKLNSINNVNFLPNLTHLCLSANKITLSACLRENLMNIVEINLSRNNIDTLQPFSKLFTLRNLDVSYNRILEFTEIKFLTNLPSLEFLALSGNPISSLIDYRVKILEYFPEKAPNLTLDNQRPTQKELDKAAVLRALTVVREGRSPF